MACRGWTHHFPLTVAGLSRAGIPLPRLPQREAPATVPIELLVEASVLTLFFAPGSSSMAPHIALHEIGAPFEARPLSLAKRETRAPEYLAVNPEGKVPALVIDGRVLTEVAGILYYLAKRFPAAGLLPAGDVE